MVKLNLYVIVEQQFLVTPNIKIVITHVAKPLNWVLLVAFILVKDSSVASQGKVRKEAALFKIWNGNHTNLVKLENSARWKPV